MAMAWSVRCVSPSSLSEANVVGCWFSGCRPDLRPPLPRRWRHPRQASSVLVRREIDHARVDRGHGKRMMVRDVPSLLAPANLRSTSSRSPLAHRAAGNPWMATTRRRCRRSLASSPRRPRPPPRAQGDPGEGAEQRASSHPPNNAAPRGRGDRQRAKTTRHDARSPAEAGRGTRPTIVLRSLVADERAKMHGSPSPPSRSAATLAPRGPVPVPGPAPVPASASSRALPPRPATASAIVTRRYLPPASFATDPLARVLAGRGSSRAPRGPDAREVARASASDVDAYARTIRGDGRRPARGGIARETDASRHAKELSTAVVATVKMFADAGVRLPLRERTGAGEGWGGAPAAGGGRAYELHGRKLTLTARGGKVLVRAGGGWSDLLEWLARNRFWERAAREREASGAGDERELFYH